MQASLVLVLCLHAGNVRTFQNCLHDSHHSLDSMINQLENILATTIASAPSTRCYMHGGAADEPAGFLSTVHRISHLIGAVELHLGRSP